MILYKSLSCLIFWEFYFQYSIVKTLTVRSIKDRLFVVSSSNYGSDVWMFTIDGSDEHQVYDILQQMFIYAQTIKAKDPHDD